MVCTCDDVTAEFFAAATGVGLVEDDADIRAAADIGQRLLDGAAAGLLPSHDLSTIRFSILFVAASLAMEDFCFP